MPPRRSHVPIQVGAVVSCALSTPPPLACAAVDRPSVECPIPGGCLAHRYDPAQIDDTPMTLIEIGGVRWGPVAQAMYGISAAAAAIDLPQLAGELLLLGSDIAERRFLAAAEALPRLELMAAREGSRSNSDRVQAALYHAAARVIRTCSRKVDLWTAPDGRTAVWEWITATARTMIVTDHAGQRRVHLAEHAREPGYWVQSVEIDGVLWRPLRPADEPTEPAS